MKKAMLIGIIIAALSSCQIWEPRINVPHFDTIEEAVAWVPENIRYVPDSQNEANAWDFNNNVEWATPEQTLATGIGDDEDRAGLAAWIIERQEFEHPQNIMLVLTRDINTRLQMMITTRGRLWNVEAGIEADWTKYAIIEAWTYEEYLRIATFSLTRSAHE